MFKKLAACLLLFACGATAQAQDIRGSISGRVTDVSGGVLIGASVSVEDMDKGIVTRLTTNEAGLYHALYLPPGRYRVSAESAGLRKAVRDNIEVNVEARLTVDIKLETSTASAEVEVVAQQPVLETSTATSGQVVDAKTIEEMPLADGTAYYLARLAPGVEFTADPKFTRPMDNVNLAGVTASGLVRATAPGENNAVSSTEFNLDGAPNMISQNRLGYSPPSSAVQEFKVSTALFDAQYGQGGGGSVSLSLKSGGNNFSGEVSYFNRDESRSANTFWTNRLQMEKEARDYHRATFTLHGPIKKNKTFFMVSAEYLFDNAPEPITDEVPTEAMRRGDFSELNIIMYDPATSRRVPGTTPNSFVTVRDPFPGNKIPEDRFSPIAREMMQYFPLPNIPRDQWGANATRNYFTDRNRPYTYDGGVARVDHVLNEKNRLFLNLFRNWRLEDRSNWSDTEMSQLFTYRTNTGGILGWTSTLSPTMILDVRANAHRFGDWGEPATQRTAADLGFSSTYVGLTRGIQNIPTFDFDTYNDFGRGFSDIPFFTGGVNPTLTKLSGNHSFKAGAELRVTRESNVSPGQQAGILQFRNGPTGAGSNNPGGGTHRDFAAFLLGVPSGGDSRFETNAERQNQVWYSGAFLQDDWRVNRRMTLNVGLRWETEFGMTERLNRNTRGFDFAATSPVEAAARARFAADFAANPASFETAPGSGKYLTTPQSFQVRGGYLFASDQNRSLWSTQKLNLLPRAGITYKVTDKLVARAGAGLYQLPYKLSGIDQRGFSSRTPIRLTDPVTTLPRLLTDPDGGIYGNPLGGGQLAEPLGFSQGLLASLGDNTGTVIADVDDREYQHRLAFQVGFQYELPFKTLLEANYVASRGYDLITARQLNYLPSEYLIDSPVRDAARETFLTNTVPNPFRGLSEFGTDDHANSAISREKLLSTYPQFESVRIQEHNGSNRYDSIQLRLEKRFTKGFMASASYTYARLLEKLTRLNDSDADLAERVGTGERPHGIKFTTVIELPFGKGRRFLSSAPGWLEAIAGGWRLSANYLWQSGQPINWDANRYYDPSRNVNDLQSHYGKDAQGRRYGVDVPAWDLSGFYFPDKLTRADQTADDRIRINSNRNDDFWTPRYKRSFPQTIDGMRQPPFHNLDLGLAKTFNLKKARLQVRIEAINAENYAQLSGLNIDPTSTSFGLFNSQNNLPRDIQVGARLTF
jgi:hypothetical protein